MPIRLSPADRMGPTVRRGGGGKALPLLVYGLVVPLTLVCVAAAGFYIATGENPADLVELLSNATEISAPMPPAVGPEKAGDSLFHPPGAAPAAVPAAKTAATPPTPQAPAPTPLKPAAGPKVTSAQEAPALREPLVPPGGDAEATPAFSALPPRRDLSALPSGPQPALLRNGPHGPLPITAEGKSPRVAYARPFTAAPHRDRIALVVVGLGLSREATEAAIRKLPPEVTLSFSPYAAALDGWMRRARAAGHEVMLDLPLQPPNFPAQDSGPLAILANATPLEMNLHLESILGKATSYVGLAGTLHSPTVGSPEWLPLLHDLRNRGLLYVGDGLSGAAQADVPPSANVTMVVDQTPFRADIDVRLARLLAAAHRDHSALAYLTPRPVTMERLLAWCATLPQRGAELAPVSAVVQPQPGGAAAPAAR
ncbi:divergent polysaccharide deacetylase [mine drainage metagenome]|uniref:Divergent polysaccharide deacetylase n=1 Tax=mine drainage metagenome TaxID=410659 RepID=A0A1J5SDB0_9ZZZZ